MYDLLQAYEAQQQPGLASAMPAAPEMTSMSPQWFSRVLDIVDYGIVMVVDGCRVVYANAVARHELAGEHALQLAGGEIGTRNTSEAPTMRRALSDAMSRRMQSMIKLTGPMGMTVTLAVVPLADANGIPAAVLVFGKRSVCEELSTDAFARLHALTVAETRVLKLLCQEYRPDDIARAVGVKLTTVRTQITSIRAKTETRDIGGIVHRVAKLPPLPCRTRRAA